MANKYELQVMITAIIIQSIQMIIKQLQNA